MNDFSQRTVALIGAEGYQKLKNSVILLVGTGGVGGYAAEFLVRAGVGDITVVDGDDVEPSNLNRQIIATADTVGMPKVEALKSRLLSINSGLKITALKRRFCSGNADEIFSREFDFVVDAIDSVKDKVSLISAAKSRGVPIVSAMGAGNRYDIPSFTVKDIYSTSGDGLARVMRKKLREAGVDSLPCVCAQSAPVAADGVIGSISYYPAVCAGVIAAYVINKLLCNTNAKKFRIFSVTESTLI